MNEGGTGYEDDGVNEGGGGCEGVEFVRVEGVRAGRHGDRTT